MAAIKDIEHLLSWREFWTLHQWTRISGFTVRFSAF